MKWSIPLGRVLGIRLGIHISFFLLIGWIAWLGWSYAGASASAWAVALIVLLFVCVILHELGHSVVALRFGIGVSSITLLPIGGVAAMKAMPEDPWQELWIAVAGPMVNVVILAILVPFAGFPAWLNIPLIPQSVPELVDALVRANMILIAFNLLPAFPMDGGRMLRAVLAMHLSYPLATAWASGIGRVVAVGFVLVGLYLNPFLALIGVFVFLGADSENRMVRMKAALKNVSVGLLMRKDFGVLQIDDTVRRCLEEYQWHGDEHFLVGHQGGIIGILPARRWMDAVRDKGVEQPIREHVVRGYLGFHAEAPLAHVLPDLLAAKQDVFPVIAHGRVVGLLVMDDVRAFIDRKNRRPRRPRSMAPPLSLERPPADGLSSVPDR